MQDAPILRKLLVGYGIVIYGMHLIADTYPGVAPILELLLFG